MVIGLQSNLKGSTMIRLALFLASFLIQPGFALAETPAPEIFWDEILEGPANTEAEGCSFQVVITSGQQFSDQYGGNQFCEQVHGIFNQRNLCFTRNYNGAWFSNFRFQRGFKGSYFDSWNNYFNWSRGHLFRGVRFNHSISFSKGC